MGHARLPRVVRLLHQASSSDRAGAGSRGWTSPAKDTTRVSHSEGHTHRHQFQPGIITEPRAVSQSFRQARHHMTGPYRLDDLPDLTC
jgi:hypothetical protein